MLFVVGVVLVPVLASGIRPPRNEEETDAPGAMDALRRGAPPMLERMAGGSMLAREGCEGVPVFLCVVYCVWHGDEMEEGTLAFARWRGRLVAPNTRPKAVPMPIAAIKRYCASICACGGGIDWSV
jgi:hypothetical protein